MRWSRIGGLWDNLPLIGVRCSGNPQCGCIRHVSIVGGLRLSTNFYIFSNIPTERPNVEFNMDTCHSFLGYEILRPYFSAWAFAHVLELDALDVGLHMWHALHDTKDKKRCIGRRKAYGDK